MDIIHSFWSKPLYQKGRLSLKGLWVNRKYFLCSWALSCLQFKKTYGNLKLITDEYGKDLFINKLKLPYTSISTDLRSLNSYHSSLWGISKIFVYGNTKKPFIHVDGDLYIWQKFQKQLESAQLVAQHLEINYDYYQEMLREVKEHFEYIPTYLCQEEWGKDIVYAYNSGIFGGNDVDFLNEYARETFTFLDRNREHLHKIQILNLAVFDQYFFYCFAREHGREKNVVCYFEDMDPKFTDLDDFKGVPTKSPFLHLLYTHKQKRKNCESLEARLRKDYPEYYYRIEYLLKNQIV